MKKILSVLAFSALTLTGFAQATQEYMRVEFLRPMTDHDEVRTGKTGTPISAGMADNYVYVNPRHAYLDFNVSQHPLTFRGTTTSIDGKKSMYIHQVRNTQSNMEDNTAKYPYDIDYISSITQYSLPVEKVTLLDSVPAKLTTFRGEKYEKDWYVCEFTFNRLPRNVAELKTLIEPNGDGVRSECCKNPAFVVAVGYLLVPRLLDCTQDCRDMFDYLCGKFDGIPNAGFSNSDFDAKNYYNGGLGYKAVPQEYNKDAENEGGKDSNGIYWDNNHAFQWFDGAMPSNQYTPNADAGYKVYVLREETQVDKNRFFLYANPYDPELGNRALDSPDAAVVYVQSTKRGFYLKSNMRNYFARGKAQTNPDL